MTQEYKDLLLKDLCARLPYGVKCHYDVVVPMIGKVKSYDKLRAISEFDSKPCFQFGSNRDIFDFDNIKPYLFPLSSMTEEQLKDVKASLHQELIDIYENGSEERKVPEYPQTWYYVQDWYNAHHFDYRGLIEKGLAIDATELNIY